MLPPLYWAPWPAARFKTQQTLGTFPGSGTTRDRGEISLALRHTGGGGGGGLKSNWRDLHKHCRLEIILIFISPLTSRHTPLGHSYPDQDQWLRLRP